MSTIAVEEIASPSLRVQDAGAKGRGVFANRDFQVGELIETAPVIVIPSGQAAALNQTALYDYTFAFGADGEDLALALGFGSLYNHSYQPNARYVRRIKDRALDFVAIRPILAGDEITVNYNGAPDEQDLVWFDVYE